MTLLGGFLLLALAFTITVRPAGAGSQDKLKKAAKIDRAQAEAIAKKYASGGKAVDAELERESGQLVWSFDFAKAGSKEITEVLVNAINGKVVNVSTENPSNQGKEKAEDKVKSQQQ